MRKTPNNPLFFNKQAQQPFQTLALGMLQLKGHFSSGILPLKAVQKLSGQIYVKKTPMSTMGPQDPGHPSPKSGPPE